MGLLDSFTGGKSKEAADAAKRAEDYFASIRTPTAQELTLPQLQAYVEAGVLTPAQAQSYLQQSNAYNDENINQAGTAAQITALNKLRETADAGMEGTPQEQAAMDAAEQNMNRSVGGQRGAIEQAMAARGTPASLIQAALANQTVGQEGQQAHMDAVNAQANAYQTALNAMAQSGSLGNQLQGQQNQQANTVAQAQNAMQQFNAQNQQQNSQFNANNANVANQMNLQNKQNVLNQNTGQNNYRTQYNANLPQQVFNNQITRAQGASGAAQNYGNLQQKQGGQLAGINAGLINTASSMFGGGGGFGGGQGGGGGGGFQPSNPTEAKFNQGYQQGWGYAHGGVVDHDHNICMAHGGYCMAEGGAVPGEAPFPGDTTSNDIVHADLSPGEAVIPRSTVAQNPEAVSSLLNQGEQPIDSQDVATLLKALRNIRLGVA